MNGDALTVEQTARAKINLLLHIVGRRSDGMHLLDSLVVFADVGDVVRAAPGQELSLSHRGPKAADLPLMEEDLVYRAAVLLAEEAGVRPLAAIELEKNLPIASGMGGGSADAAAALRALIELWQLDLAPGELNNVALRLGADVPVCLAQETAQITGIGEVIEPVRGLPALPAVLVNCGQPLDTGEVFAAYAAQALSDETQQEPVPEWSSDLSKFASQLTECRNDLTVPAQSICATIRDIIGDLDAQSACLLARMSGSGGTCFGLFATPGEARAAAEAIRQDRPSWWIVATTLNAAKV